MEGSGEHGRAPARRDSGWERGQVQQRNAEQCRAMAGQAGTRKHACSAWRLAATAAAARTQHPPTSPVLRGEDASGWLLLMARVKLFTLR